MLAVVGALAALALTACQAGPDGAGGKDYGDIRGVEELAQPLTALTSVTWTSTSGTLDIALQTGETLAVVSRNVGGFIVVNDVVQVPTSITLKKLNITGGAGNETVILDYANGLFAPGAANNQGTFVNLGAGTDALKVRGVSATADTVSIGGVSLAAEISLNTDTIDDITVTGTGTIAYTFSLGGGADTFNGTASQNGVIGPFQEEAGTTAATGSITALAPGMSGIADGDTFTLNDGVNPAVTFEFDVAGGTAGVTAGNTSVAVGAMDTADQVATAMRTAINGITTTLAITAAGSAASVTLSNDVLGVVGNVAITEVGGLATITGMTGGVGGDGPGVTVFGGTGNDVLTGTGGNDTISGDEGDDTISGGTANYDSDVLKGGTEADAGTGTDIVTYAARSVAVDVSVGSGVDDGASAPGETDDVQSDVEVVLGGSGADTFTNTDGKQTFKGGAGNDTFLMGASTVTAATDVLLGEAGTDVVSFAARTADVVVKLDSTASSGATSENVTVTNDIENVICPTGTALCTVTGSASDNTVTCSTSSGGCVFTAGAGNDAMTGPGTGGTCTFTGEAGNDTLTTRASSTAACTFVGGAGDDTIVLSSGSGAAHDFKGGDGTDFVNFSSFGATINVTMDYAASTTPTGMKIDTDVENLTCATASACTVTGNARANKFFGSSAVDTFTAGDGDDFIETNGNDDVVNCGSGSDILIGTTAGTVTSCEL